MWKCKECCGTEFEEKRKIMKKLSLLCFCLLFSQVSFGQNMFDEIDMRQFGETEENEIINTTIDLEKILKDNVTQDSKELKTYHYLLRQSIEPYTAEEIYQEVLKNAREFEVDPQVIVAIIKQESNFRNGLTSSAGALGLMQLMPGTAKSMGVSNPWDIAENIRGGVKYFKECLKRTNHDLALALASYNAGLGNVLKYNGIPPFAETQAYVANILKIYNKEFENHYVYNEVAFEESVKGLFADISFSNSAVGEI